MVPGFGERLTGQSDRLPLALVAALLVGCLTPALMLLLLVALGAHWSDTVEAPTLLSGVRLSSAMVIFLPAGVLLLAMIGLPLHLLLAALNRQSRLAYGLGGAASLGLFSLLILGPESYGLLASASGGLAGLAFRSFLRP